MLSRSSAVIVSATSLITGIVLGMILARGGPVVSAQVARPGQYGNAARSSVDDPPPSQPDGVGQGRIEEGATAPGSKQAKAISRQKQADDAIYDALARQYEQFQQVNRTFEL